MRAFLTVFTFACWLAINSTVVSAQESLPPAGGTTSLEVISVKSNRSGENPGNIHPLPDGIRMDNIRLSLLLRLAYGFNDNRQVIGAPEWVRAESFDIEARVAESDLKAFNSLPAAQRTQSMLQTILADRFKLVAHRETRPMPGYALVVAKEGAKLQPRKIEESPQSSPYLSTSIGQISMREKPLASLAAALTRQTGRPVEDRSALAGNFDVELHWKPEMGEAPLETDAQQSGVAVESSEPGLFTALKEQLGLRLEPAKVPVEWLIVDHIERPEAN